MLKLKFVILSLSIALSISNRCPIFRCPTAFLENQCSYHDTIEGEEVYDIHSYEGEGEIKL